MTLEARRQHMTADTQQDLGDIAGTIEILRNRLRAVPGDQRARMFLFQILCVEGAWEKARAQLKMLAELSPDARMLSLAYNQAIDGEVARRDACGGGASAPLLRASPGWVSDLADAFAADAHSAAAMRARAFDASPDAPGDVDGRPFDYMFDGDGRFGPAFEAIIAGRWGLMPFCVVEQIKSEGPVDLRDTVWLPVEIRLRDGGAVAALLPARYPDTELQDDLALRLGRRTDWHGTDPVRGLGQRVWTTSTGEDIGILSFRTIRFTSLS
ncbi:type VI secretion system accessory protein TagJ [Sphingomonas arantia]|uniref:Type VI secretion system accessory protein TagJ n=1 Tax=Sphingomonas arantia TaxID=1460676 RepID=A0ABW4U1K9_9SPHN